MRYRAIASVGTGLIAEEDGGATLWTVNVNTGAPSAILKIYDGESAAGTLIAEIDASSKSSVAYGCLCDDGIYWQLSGGNAQVTIGYG